MPGCARCQGLREKSKTPCPPRAQSAARITESICHSGLYSFISVWGLGIRTFPSFCQCMPIFRNLCPFSVALLNLNIPLFMTKYLIAVEHHPT